MEATAPTQERTRFVPAPAAPPAEEFSLTPSSAQEETAAAVEERGQKRDAASSASSASSGRPGKIPCYRDVDVSTWTTRVKCKNSYGSPIVLVFGLEGAPQMALSHRDEERGYFPFKLDLEPANGGAVPSFLSGKPDPTKATEGLDMQITLTPAQAEFAAAVDDWAKKQAAANSREWFGGKALSAAEIESLYTPILRRDPDGKYAPKLKAKIVLSGTHSDLLTKVTYVRSGNGGQTTGAGWDFVKPLLGSSQWRGNEARAVVEIRRIWIVGKKFGLTVQYKYLVVVEKETRATNVDFPELDM